MQLVGVQEEKRVLGRLVEIVVRENGVGGFYSFLRYAECFNGSVVSDSQQDFSASSFEAAEDILRKTCYDIYYQKC